MTPLRSWIKTQAGRERRNINVIQQTSSVRDVTAITLIVEIINGVLLRNNKAEGHDIVQRDPSET